MENCVETTAWKTAWNSVWKSRVDNYVENCMDNSMVVRGTPATISNHEITKNLDLRRMIVPSKGIKISSLDIDVTDRV